MKNPGLLFMVAPVVTVCVWSAFRHKEVSDDLFLANTGALVGNESVYGSCFGWDYKVVTYIDSVDCAGCTYPVCFDEKDDFNRLNHFPVEMTFQTFQQDGYHLLQCG